MRSKAATIAALVLSGFVFSVVTAPLSPAHAKKGNLRAICAKKVRANTPGNSTPQERKRRGMLFRQCLRNGGKL